MFRDDEPVIKPYGVKGFSSRFYAYRVGVQLIPTGVLTRVQFNTLLYDILDEYDEAVAYQFNPRQSGYYSIIAQITFPAMPVGTYGQIYLNIGGATYALNSKVHDGLIGLRQQVSLQAYLLSTQNINVRVWQNSGVGQNLTPLQNLTYLQAFRFA